MTNNVFVYGSLLADEVVQKLLSRMPKALPATVRGYQRHRIKQRRYPATIRSSETQQVTGRVLFDLSPHELEILDDFEDEDYYREVVTAETQDSNKVQAAMYVWQDSLRSLLYGAWDYEEFRKNNLKDFLQMMDDWEHSGAFPEDAPEEIG